MWRGQLLSLIGLELKCRAKSELPLNGFGELIIHQKENERQRLNGLGDESDERLEGRLLGPPCLHLARAVVGAVSRELRRGSRGEE